MSHQAIDAAAAEICDDRCTSGCRDKAQRALKAAAPYLAAPAKCPATTRVVVKAGPYSNIESGVQCKFTPAHDGDHCGYIGPSMSEHFWPQEPKPALPQTYGA